MGKYIIVILVVAIAMGGVLYYLPVLLGRAMDPADAAGGTVKGEEVVVSESLIYYSDDGGKTFNAAHFEYSGGPLSVTGFQRAQSGRFYAATDRGLAVSDDQGASWGLISDDADVLRSADIISLAIDDERDGVGYVSVRQGTMAYIFRTTDSFKTVVPVFVSEENIAAISMEMRGHDLYLGMSDGEIVVYNEKSGTFRLYGSISAPVSWLAIKNNGAMYAVTGSKGIYRYEEATQKWVRAGEASLKAIAKSLTIFGISSNPALPQELLLATSAGIVRTRNSGKTWELLPTALPESSLVESIAGGPIPVIFAGKGNTVYTSMDGGVTWSIRPFVENTRTVSEISIFENGKHVFVGTTGERMKSAASFGFSFFSPPKFVAPER